MTTNTRAARDDWGQHWTHYAKAATLNPAQRYRGRIELVWLRRSGCAGRARILDSGSGQGDLALDLQQAFPEAELAGAELSAAGVAEATREIPGAYFPQCDLWEKNGFTVKMAITAGFRFFNLYRRAVTLRGKRSIKDVRSGSTAASSGLARVVMSAFRPLFALNIMGSSLGWQTIAAARWPGDAKL